MEGASDGVTVVTSSIGMGSEEGTRREEKKTIAGKRPDELLHQKMVNLDE